MRSSSSAMLIAAFCGCSITTDLGQPENDFDEPARTAAVVTATSTYRITQLPSLAGTLSRGTAINGRSQVAGWSNRSDGSRHAALWKNGVVTDLLTLGGPSSTVAWPGLNDQGVAVGVSQTAEIDPLNEDWSCEAGGFLPETTNLICRGFVWSEGVMRELPTLGGHHGFAAGINNRGKIVGWAETNVHDPTCTGVQVLQFRAALWEPKKREISVRELAPWPGDATSAATAINDRGDAVGISGDCDQAVGRFSARHAVLWKKNGQMTEIPNLGGVTWHTPTDINEAGDVVGFSNPVGPGDPDGEFISHAFLWKRGAPSAIDLGTLPGDLFSEAFAVNARGQIVGVSFGGANGSRAFLWQDGQMTDLNALREAGNVDVLLSGQDINDAGQITGRLRDPATGETLAFVATPEPCR